LSCFKSCPCGAAYTLEEWRALPRVGIVDVERDLPAAPNEAPVDPFELRTCSVCGSTVGKPIPYEGGSEYPPPAAARGEQGATYVRERRSISMFRNDEQAARACRALLATARLERLWTADGPGERAVELLDADGGPLPSDARIMLLAAFAFWHGSSSLRLTEIIETLDLDRSEAICSLLLAMKEGAAAVDDWLAEYDVPKMH
jgi:hypothetical protein